MVEREGADKDAAGVEIVSKAAAAVFALAEHGEVTAQQLAEHVDEPVSSTYRLLTQLTHLGWVERGSRRGLFRLGLMFLRIGGMVEDRIDVRRIVLPLLESVVAQTRASSFLCVRRGSRAVCIERVEGGDVRSLAMRIGDSLPLHSGAASMAILAFLPASERDAYLEQLGALDGRPVERTIAAEIDRVRGRGYALSDGDVTPGIAAVAAPVYNHRGELECTISLSGLRHRIVDDLEATAALIQDAAARASAALGMRAAR